MGEDSVIACAVRPQPGDEYVLDHYYNDGYDSDLYNPTDYGISDPRDVTNGNELHCFYNRDILTEVNGIIFDLDNQPFYIQLATGKVKNSGEIGIHSAVSSSPQAYLLSDFQAEQ